MARSTRRTGWSVESICQDLRRRILMDGFLAGQIPGERLLAEHYHATLRAVREAIDALIDEGLLVRKDNRRYRIRPGATEFLAQRGLIRQILMVSQGARDASNPFTHHMALGASERAAAKRIRFELHRLGSHEGKERIESIRASAGMPHATGWIIHHSSIAADFYRRWLMEKIPFVLVDQIAEGIRVNNVAFDSEQAIYEATDHLVKLGHRHIGCIGAMLDESISRSRRQGFCRALERNHLPVRPEWIVNDRTAGPTGLLRDETPRVAEELLARADRPTGLVCFNTRIGNEVLAAAERLGIDVPARLSVIAAGTYYTPNAVPTPGLTRIEEGRPEQLGALAVDLLTRPDVTLSCGSLLVRGHLVEGSTTAPPPAERG